MEAKTADGLTHGDVAENGRLGIAAASADIEAVYVSRIQSCEDACHVEVCHRRPLSVRAVGRISKEPPKQCRRAGQGQEATDENICQRDREGLRQLEEGPG